MAGHGEVKSKYCSFDAPGMAQNLKYFACPHDPTFCGEEDVLTPPIEGELMHLIPQNEFGSYLTDEAGCRYKIIFPVDAH